MPLAVILLAATQCVLTGWGRWGDLMVDTGRELELPRRILGGETLYVDLRFYYGPLSPYLNALLYRVFGVRLEVLAAAGVLSAVIAGLTLFALAKFFVDRLGATAIALTFFYACAFSHYDRRGIFNWVLPHTFAATYGMLAALLSLYFLVRYAREGQAWQHVLSVCFLALSALAKIETFFPALVAHALWLVVASVPPRRRSLGATGVAALAVAGVYGAFFRRAGPALWKDNLAGVMNPGSDFFIDYVMGFQDLPGNLFKMLLGAGLLAATAGIALAASTIVRRKSLGARARAAIAALTGALVVACLLALADNPDVLLRATSPLVAAVFAVLLWTCAKAPGERAKWVPDLLVWSFALASLPRIALRATPEVYGYFLLPPAILCLGIVLFGYLPRLLDAGGCGRISFAAAGLALILGSAAMMYRVSLENMADKTIALETSRGSLRLLPVVAAMFVPLMRLVERSPPGATLLVLPESSAINFLSGHRGVDGMFSHLPMEYWGGFTEEVILARWKRAPPDLILFHDALMPQFGNARYCLTYGRKTCQWMTHNYAPLTDPNEDAILLAPRSR